MASICDNVFSPDRENPGTTDMVILWTRMQMGMRDTGASWGKAMGNLIEQDGAHVAFWLMNESSRLSDERYESDMLFGRWDCEILHECYCAYGRAGLSPLDWMLVESATKFYNPHTHEVRTLTGEHAGYASRNFYDRASA